MPITEGDITLPSGSERLWVYTMRSIGTTSLYMPVKYICMPSGDFMLHKWRPPTFRSISQLGVVKPFGPYHFAKCCGFVQAFHSNSRGASKLRLTTICLSSERSIFLPFSFGDLTDGGF